MKALVPQLFGIEHGAAGKYAQAIDAGAAEALPEDPDLSARNRHHHVGIKQNTGEGHHE